jgi:hypothetical protein
VIQAMPGLLATLLAAGVGATSPGVTVAYSISVSSNNGSVPPPHHRATDIDIDANGHGRYSKRLGYDRNDSHRIFQHDFRISAAQQHTLAALIRDLRIFETEWREVERPNVGGSSVSIRCSHGSTSVVIPSQLIPEQRQARDQLVQATQALVPEDVIKAMTEWSEARQDQE